MALNTDPAAPKDGSFPEGSFPKGTGAEVLLDYLRQQSAELQSQVPGIRANDPEAVHRMRTAVRRLRSVLATGRKLFDAGSVDGLRAELKWLAGVLGKARDPQATHERLGELLSAEPADLVPGSPGERLDQELDSSLAEGQGEVLEALDGARYSRLAASLASMVDQPRLTAKAERPPAKTMRKLVAKDAKRLRRKVKELKALPPEAGQDQAGQDQAGQDQAGQDGVAERDGVTERDGEAERERQLHEIRKAAKRLRYAAEAAVPVLGKPVKRLEKSAHQVQKILGLHQDSVVARTRLVELGSQASGTGESGFTFGRLHAKEEARAAEAEADFTKAWKKFPKFRA